MIITGSGQVLGDLDDSWRAAHENIMSMPDRLADDHKDRLRDLFQIHAATLKGIIKTRLSPEKGAETLHFIDGVIERMANRRYSPEHG